MIVVQARMGSHRLPGKVLRPVAGTTVLEMMLDRLALVDDQVVVATSDQPGDDPVARIVESRSEGLHRGSESDVLGRIAGAAAGASGPIVRITADCPFVDPGLVRAIRDIHVAEGADYTSNTLLRTFPDGLDVEVFGADALARADAEAVETDEREHVSPYVVRRPDEFRLLGHVGLHRLEDERWTIDDLHDFRWLEHTLATDPTLRTAGWTDVLATVGVRRAAPPGSPVLRVSWTRSERPRSAHRFGSTTDLPLLDPGHRTWDVLVADRVAGQLAVPVRRGVGELQGWISCEVDVEAVLGALELRLAADLQVREIRARELPADLSDRFRSRGYQLDAGIATRIRIPSSLETTGATT